MSEKRVSIHRLFLDSLTSLRPRKQKKVKETIGYIIDEKELNSIRPHKVGKFWSYSASDSLRIISYRSKEAEIILHVGEHDEAYEWANRHEAISKEDDEFLGVVDKKEMDYDIEDKSKEGYDPIYDKEEFQKYVSIGLPVGLSKLLSKADENQTLETISKLAPEVQEQVLSESVKETESKRGKPSDIQVVEDDEALEAALKLPSEKWRLFLHPKQRFAVDMPSDRHIMIKGGPGTGKTVTAIHRYSRLSNDQTDGYKPVFFTIGNTTKEIIYNKLDKIGAKSKTIIPINEIEHSKRSIRRLLDEYTHVIIDEGQDMPLRYMSKLKMVFDEEDGGITPHFICYDPNQCVSTPSGDAIDRISGYFDEISLNYSYRSTKQNVNFGSEILERIHSKFDGKKFQDRHKIASSRSEETSRLTSGIQGPSAQVTQVENTEAAAKETALALEEFDSVYQKAYASAILLVGSRDKRKSFERSARSRGVDVPILKASKAKGREFFAGVVVDLNSFPHNTEGEKILINSNKYKEISSVYVAVTRFRDRVQCIYTESISPLNIQK